MFGTDTLSLMPRKPLPENEKKVPLTTRIAPSLLDALQMMAQADDRTLSYVAEKAIREFIEKHRGKGRTHR